MASAGRRARPTVDEESRAHPERFEFFQMVRLLEASARRASRPALPVGLDADPASEVARFCAWNSLAFPESHLARHEPAPSEVEGPQPRRLHTTFLGLTGAQGVLPRHYTSLIIERVKQRDPALRDFLDLFHHRLVSLFYRVWEKHRFAIGFERAQRGTPGLVDEAPWREGEDLFTFMLRALVGLAQPGLRQRQTIDDSSLVFYAGHFAHFPRSASALEAVLGDYFGMPLRVEQFQGRWLYLRAEDRSQLPSLDRPRGQYCRLGVDALAGERVWDVRSHFRVRVGPLVYDEFLRLMPRGDVLQPLCELARTYVGPEFEFDVQAVLAAAEVPECLLGAPEPLSARLGWNTWLLSGPAQRDADDAVFRLAHI